MLRESKLSQLIHHSDESSLALVAKVTERKINHILVQAVFPPKALNSWHKYYRSLVVEML